ncbi:hypothetical protein LOTGIDRAFT_193093 [Lottia gigantea]|uniref:Phosphatidylinositol N-acetylglucosaminyltransferase subunit P n=1 Tax=Lottia gigantea TaxID=225164 RepID=V4A1I6_LOTGI|nr:hypothetical protein LOTGIDRAFT_193093 [Lottia gigantea]ESO88790.1 hypothetical protein LOTGIDRAFT_193093 [Lottia gigantea]
MTNQNSPSPTPKRAIYGFVLYLSAHLAFLIYVLWAFLPDELLRAAGFTYYPNKHWAITFPFTLFLGFLLAFPIYMILSYFKSAPLNSLDTITDNYAKDLKTFPIVEGQISPIADLNISHINRNLYLDYKL